MSPAKEQRERQAEAVRAAAKAQSRQRLERHRRGKLEAVFEIVIEEKPTSYGSSLEPTYTRGRK